jgi:hypothetical protein
MRRLVWLALLVGLFLSGCGTSGSQKDLKPLPGNRIPTNADRRPAGR